MTANFSPRSPLGSDDDLLLDRPAPQDRRPARLSAPQNEFHALRAVRECDRDEGHIVYVQAPPPRTGALEVIGRGIGLLAKLTLLLILLATLWGVVSFVGIGMRAPGAIGERITGALEQGASAAAAAAQRAADTFDPAHPPRQALVHDAEIDELLRLGVGAQVPGSATRIITVASIQRQAAPTSPDTALYALLHSELRQPHETKVLGMTLHTSLDPQDHFLYKGETVRIGQTLYRVNWVSAERQQIALIQYREQDRVAAQVKLQID